MNFYLAQLFLKVPDTCPFARVIQIGDLKFTVPPLCKLNPFYNQIMEAKIDALEAAEEYDFDLITVEHFKQALKLLLGKDPDQARLAREFLKSPSYWITTSNLFNKS